MADRKIQKHQQQQINVQIITIMDVMHITPTKKGTRLKLLRVKITKNV